MSECEFELAHNEFLGFMQLAEEMGFNFVNGSRVKNKEDICQTLDLISSNTFPCRSGHFFLMPDFEKYESLQVKEVVNVHSGPMFYVSAVCGGPYLEIVFGVDSGKVFRGALILKSTFSLSHGGTVKPSESLRESFRKLSLFARSHS